MTKTELQELISKGVVTDVTLFDNPDLDKLTAKDLVEMGVVTKVADAEAILNAKPEETPGDETGKEPGDENPEEGDENPGGGSEGGDENPGGNSGEEPIIPYPEPDENETPEGDEEPEQGIVVDEEE